MVTPQLDDYAAAPAPRTFGNVIESVDIVSRISQMLQGTSRPERSHSGQKSWDATVKQEIVGLAPAAVPN